MEIIKTFNGNEATFAVEGWLDTQAASTMEEAISSIPAEVETLTLDLAKMEYISSSGIRQIVAAHKKMNGKLTLKNVSTEALDLLRLTGLDKRLNIQ